MQVSRKQLLIGSLVFGIAALATILYLFAPEQHAFYPQCLLFATTGLQCPGCGGLRAGHALLHGDLETAFHLNPLLIILLPAIIWMIAVLTIRQTTGKSLPNPFVNAWCGWTALVVLVVFAITRNL